MTDKFQTTSQADSAQVRELTPDELEHANGGAFTGGVYVGLADGSVRNLNAGDYNTWRTNFGAGGG